MGRFIWLHNRCGCGRCKAVSCYGCGYCNYYVVFGNGKKEIRLPQFVQAILRWTKKY